MSDLDVRMKLRLDYRRNAAERAERDLQAIGKAADRLRRSGAGNLDKDLAGMARNARQAGQALSVPADKLRQLNRLKTDQVEGEVRSLNRAASQLAGKLKLPADRMRALNRLKTDKAEAEIKSLSQAVKQGVADLRKMDRTKLSRLRGEFDRSADGLRRVHRPAEDVNRSMGFLTTSAGNAMGALLAFASVDNIVRGLERMADAFRDVDDAAARTAVTAEMRDPKVVDRIVASNQSLAAYTGLPLDAVGRARDVFAAANFSVARQEKVMKPAMKAAFAAKSDPAVIARAVTAAINNLGITEDQVPAFLDQIVKGGKEGEFEIEAMAKSFPELGALYRASGRSGLDASAELIALAQVVRKGAGMEAGAATNLQNLLSKMAAPDTVKNFKEKGVDLRKLAARASKKGTPYIIELLDEIERITGGDEFKIGELFGDMQAKSALRPLLQNREFYKETLSAVRGGSKGVVNQDFDFLSNRPKAEADRRSAGWGEVGRRAGQMWNPIGAWLSRRGLAWLNPSWGRGERRLEDEKRLRGVDIPQLEREISEIEKTIAGRKPSRFGLPDMEKQKLEIELLRLRGELEAARKVQNPKEPTDKTSMPADGTTPVPLPKPEKVSAAYGSAGQEAGRRFKEGLEGEARKSAAIADKLKSRFSFTATPTVRVRFTVAPSGPPAVQRPPADGPVNINQRVVGGHDPVRTARLTIREANREIRAARARALHDTGMPA
ncbi:phage tail tape measure protein [Breoghania sp.]|uniref:phage tail tape measure protein n=1 Tax=Breoghania sp. TaxID=2065378 RepID=UPI0029CA63D8|nr:phage tail tape measure protein [Breoghania sp.]